MTALPYDKVKDLVTTNNVSDLSDELIIAVCWKESSFDPGAKNQSPNSSATGLMMLTKDAVGYVNNNTPQGTHFEHGDMTDAEKNIACGTWYLRLLLKRNGHDVKAALESYGTGEGYADDLLKAETCLKQLLVVDKMTCLYWIHK